MPAVQLSESQHKAVAQYILDLVAAGGTLEKEVEEKTNPEEDTSQNQ